VGDQPVLEHVELVVVLGIVLENPVVHAVQVPQARDVGIEREHDADRRAEPAAHAGDARRRLCRLGAARDYLAGTRLGLPASVASALQSD
jgi:hypothetical protein